MDITTEEKNGVTIVRMSGKINVPEAQELMTVIEKLIDDGKHKLVIDFCEIKYIGSLGVGVLATLLRKVIQVGGSMKLVSLNLFVKKIFTVTKLDKIFEIYDSLDECLNSFS
ncbi:MAG: STAS domain-containing protein [bacterium]|nr:STAS domain-containing protein [bacterium]